jgi:ABC-type dipeptide/oligopeptide/nickel transport system permease component
MLQRFIARRFLLLLPVLFAISVIVFAVIRFAPGDPALMLISFEDYTPELADQMRAKLGLDKPVPVQYWIWLKRVVSGDLGKSLFTKDPVLDLIIARMPTTLILTFGTLLFAVAISIPLGMASAVRKDSWVDNTSRIVAMIGVSMPVFWFGLLLLVTFSLKLRWLPPGGDVKRFGPTAALLPWVTLGLTYSALLTRTVRTEVIEVLQQDYVRTAMAKGLKPHIAHYRHALKNAMLPVITVIGIQVGGLLGGAVLTETIFDMPGLGRLLVDSLLRRDYPVIQGCILVITVIFVVTNLVVDVTYAFFDPRVRLE